jgi:hypothetical protein
MATDDIEGGYSRATWFETALARLLTMRITANYFARSFERCVATATAWAARKGIDATQSGRSGSTDRVMTG